MTKNIEIKFTREKTEVTIDKTAIFDLGKIEKIELEHHEYDEETKSVNFFYENPDTLEKNKKNLDKLAKITESESYLNYKYIYSIDLDKGENIFLKFE